MGARRVRRGSCLAPTAAAARPTRDVPDPALLRSSRVAHLRNDGAHNGPGRGVRRAPGACVRADQAVSRRALASIIGGGTGRGRECSLSSATALPAHILIPLANPRTAADLVRIGAGLLRPGGTITALGIVEVAEGVPLSEGATRARQARRLLQRVLEFVPQGVELRTVVRIGRRAAEGVIEVAGEESADLIIFGWSGRPSGKRGTGAVTDAVFSPTIDEVVRDAPCNIAVIKQRGIKDVSRILAPVRGGPHAELALRYAAALGRYFEADVDVMHIVPPDISPVARAQVERALATFVRGSGDEPARPLLVEGTNIAAAIINEAELAELVVMGAAAVAPATTANLERALFGELPETVAQHARPSVIVVKTRDAITRHTFDQRAEQSETLE